jgi:hypothetical protein
MMGFLQLYQTTISPVVRFAIPILAILFLWFGLARAGVTPKTRTSGLLATGLLLAWWMASELLGRSGFYAQHWDVMRPVGWMIAILWLIPLLRSAAIGGALDAAPLWLLPLVQVYRAAGGLVWFGQLAAGRVPATFGLVAGTGDVLVGILAVMTAIYVYSGVRGGRLMAIAWNTLGLLDFAIGFVIASFLPYSAVYPAVMIPAFLAPLSLDLHALSLRQLMRAMRREPRPATLADAQIA